MILACKVGKVKGDIFQETTFLYTKNLRFFVYKKVKFPKV
jgi:hypothetical protein